MIIFSAESGVLGGIKPGTGAGVKKYPGDMIENDTDYVLFQFAIINHLLQSHPRILDQQ